MAILDADKEGFLRSESSLIQTMGRAARNVNGQVIMYADRVTESMQAAIEGAAGESAAGAPPERARRQPRQLGARRRVPLDPHAGRDRVVGREHRRNRDALARLGGGLFAVDQSVAARPHAVVCRRQIGHDEAALIVGRSMSRGSRKAARPASMRHTGIFPPCALPSLRAMPRTPHPHTING